MAAIIVLGIAMAAIIVLRIDVTGAPGADGNLPALVEIPAGTFMMGSEQGKKSEVPVHEVKIASPFYLSATEITFDEYDAFSVATKGEIRNDRSWGSGDLPVVFVSWHDARAYAEWLGEQTNKACRLPSEAEWEYAARAGTTGKYALPAPGGGDDLTGKANYAADDGVDWADRTSVSVASFPANAWGLHDMHGNVIEWVEDCWHDSYAGAPADGSAWTDEDGGNCNSRVLRGGSWSGDQGYVRSADRYYDHPLDPSVRHYYVGFRVLCSSPID